MKETFTTQDQVRAEFWDTTTAEWRSLRRARKRQNDYPTDVRVAWCNFVDMLRREERISEKLAYNVTL